MFKRILSKKNRALLAELVRTDFKLRYQGSVLGYAWSLLQPLFFFLILYFVFSYLKVSKGIPHYSIYLLIGIVIWNFFREMSSQSITSIVARGDLIRKIRIPRWIIILSSSISAVISLAFNLVIIGIFLVVTHVVPLSTVIWLPLILIEVYIFALGISLFLSAAFVKYRDVSYIWDVLMQGGFYLTPIIYPITKIPNETVQKLIMINPMSQAIQDARYSMVWHGVQTTPDTFNGGWYKFVPFIIVVVFFVIGLRYFRSQSKYFAENI
ncbi:MAG TPA: ABC transporter permease [Candidatus Saccharimonadales bacterium]|nr:ABC transporter permease [Candidatus Saccharimonadales bacterium]